VLATATPGHLSYVMKEHTTVQLTTQSLLIEWIYESIALWATDNSQNIHIGQLNSFLPSPFLFLFFLFIPPLEDIWEH